MGNLKENKKIKTSKTGVPAGMSKTTLRCFSPTVVRGEKGSPTKVFDIKARGQLARKMLLDENCQTIKAYPNTTAITKGTQIDLEDSKEK